MLIRSCSEKILQALDIKQNKLRQRMTKFSELPMTSAPPPLPTKRRDAPTSQA